MLLQTVPARQGLQWALQGMRVFWKQPLAMSGLFFLFMALISLVSVLPLVGGVVALAVSGEYLSVPASVGFIALMGMAVLNGLVLVTGFNQLLSEGMPLADVVRAGAVRRLRPVLMTASITALGLIPLLLATGPGSEVQRPLAVVVMGGLFSATALTLVLLPMMFQRYGVRRS